MHIWGRIDGQDNKTPEGTRKKSGDEEEDGGKEEDHSSEKEGRSCEEESGGEEEGRDEEKDVVKPKWESSAFFESSRPKSPLILG